MYKLDYDYLINILKGKDIDKDYIVKDYYSLLGFILVNKIGGYFYNQCLKFDIKLPKQIQSALFLTYSSYKVRNNILRKFIYKLSYELEAKHINHAFLKGSILSNSYLLDYKTCIYDIGERVSNDIDILISASDLTKVEKILTKLNFKQGYYDYKKNKIILFSRKEIINRRINRGETAPFILKTSNKIVPFIEIDLNFSVNETANDTLSNKLLNNTIAYLSIKNTYIRSLSKYDFVVFLIMHAYKEMNVLFMIKHNKDLLLYKFLDLYLLLKDINLLTLYNLIVEYNIEKEAKLVIQATAILFKCEALTNYLNNFNCDEKLIIKDYENKKNYIFTNSIQERILNFNNLKYLKEIDYE